METAAQKDIDNAMARLAKIDEVFADARGWGSWMVGLANEREALVNNLARFGVVVAHKYLARTGSGGRVS